ncbi:MAG TPA: hypothetical protein VLV86_00970, partial [Vicinamibacterales bacterium]|nr:hypothetical protein [Vicinamibacterales bacterium]
KWAIGLWLGVTLAVVACSVVLDARLSTSVLLFVVCAIPVGIIPVIAAGASPPTIAELLDKVGTDKRAR